MDETTRRAAGEQTPGIGTVRVALDWLLVGLVVLVATALAIAELSGTMSGFVHNITLGA